MSDVVQKPTKVSREGVILIKSFEGFRPRAVQRKDGRWMIGYGHTQSAREGLTISESDAELLLQHDLIPVVRAVKAIQTPLNQHQFDSIASFAFSVGVDRFKTSDVLARLNAGAPEEAADAMTTWADDAAAEGPPRRRAAERALFFAKPGTRVALADLLAAPVPSLPHTVRFDDPTPATLVSTPLALSSDTPDAAAFPLDEAAPDASRATGTASNVLKGEEVAPFPLDPDAPVPVPSFEEATASLADSVLPPADLTAVVEHPLSNAAAFHRYSPFGMKAIGPLPTFDQPTGILAGDPSTRVTDILQDDIVAANDAATTAPNAVHEVATELSGTISDAVHPISKGVEAAADGTASAIANFQNPAPNEPSIVASTLDALDRPNLALTASEAAEAATGQRVIWGNGSNAVDPTQQALVDPAAEAEPAPLGRPYDPRAALPRRSGGWSETWTFLAMLMLGLIAFGTAMAAFRRAAITNTPDSATIGWVLALIAVACVGVSGYNLYQRWGRGERQ